MKYLFRRIVVLFSCALFCFCSVTLRAQLLAFPGAEGFGKYATGARGGTVYHVTTTNDTGAGSFRDAVSVSGRTVVFDVGGVIDYQSPRYAPKPNVTIAGQTAPGDGVTIYGNGLSFSGSHNNIARFIRVREGINGDSGTDAMGIANGHDMIFDHISDSWGRDETFSISGDVDNITIQSTIVSQGLQGHSAGGLIQTEGGVSILRCLYIDNDTRNPKVKFVNEFVNNVICNWETIGYNMGGDSAGDSYVNNLNNYFMRGPASSSSAISGGNANFHIYATNNWYDGNRDGVLNGTELAFASYGSMDLQSTPYAYPITNAYSPLTALKLAVSDAGASFRRDYVDDLMVSQLTSWGISGGTITSELVAPMHGPGLVRNGAPYTDTDQDGMPDYWENGTGSNAGSADNNGLSPSGSGYTRLEDYLNWLAEPHGIALTDTNVVIDLRQFTRGWVLVNHTPTWSVANPTNGSVTLINSYFAKFTPTAALNGPAGFRFTVNDSDGGPITRTMNLFFTPAAHNYQPIWHGDDLTNNWDALGDHNWHDGISLLYQFHNGEAVTFDDTGSTAPAVNLVGSLQPASVTANSTKNYTFSGSGSLDGSMTLNKTNTGTLTIANTNNFNGATTVSSGVLLVNGTLLRSAVTVKVGGSIGGKGRLGNGLSAQVGSTLVPGNGLGSAGTLTITNTLTESGSVTNRFDFSDDPTGTTKTNDLIRVIGNLNVSGTNIIKVSLLDGLPGNGIYTLITYTGTFSGGLTNFTVSGVIGTLTNLPNAIAIIVDASRPPAGIVWSGNGGNNFWDTGTSVTWLNDGAPDRFYFLDDVMFNDTGSSNLIANLVGDLTPNSVTVDATVNYTLTSSGKITGTGGLTKTNSGTLAILTTNDYSGPTIIGGGILSASRLANSGAASSIGAASYDSANLVLGNGTLSYTGGSVSSDRGATFNTGTATFDIPNSGTSLTWNGTNVGPGILVKSGPGTLILSAESSFSGGTVVSNGTLALFGPSGGATITANNYALGSGTVTLYGGTLRLFGGSLGDAAAGYGTFSRPLVVPDGATVTLLTPARYTMSSSLTGNGTVNMEVNYVRGTLSGNWSAFTGLINVTARVADSEFRIANSSGYAGATIFLNDDVIMDRSGGAITIEIGALGGTSGAVVGPGNSSSGGSSYRVGWNNTDATFAGQLQNDGANTFTKVGTGNWTLTGANTYTGGTVVNGGTLTVNNTSGSGTGAAAVTVNTGATLAGKGIISGAVTVNSGATVSPGMSIGTLTVNNTVSLASGSTTFIEINKTALTKDLLSASGTLTYGGTLIVTNLSGTLTNGDSFKIFNGSSYAGSFASSNLPPLAPDLMWNTTPLKTSGTITVVSTNFTGPQFLIWTGDGVSNIWDSGTSVNWVTTNNVARAFLNGDSATFDDSGDNSPPVVLAGSLAPGFVTVNAAQDYVFSGTGSLTGIMPLTKSGNGKLTVVNSSANSFTGGTTINAGALQLGDGASVTVNLPGNITNKATLIYANPGAVTTTGLITGNGALKKNGAGTLTLNGTQNYTGLTTVDAGLLQINGTPPPSDITNNATLFLNPANFATYANSISGPGNVSKNGTTALTLSGSSTFSGNLTNTGGILMLANNQSAGSGTVVYHNGLVVVMNGVTITNNYSLPTNTATDLCMMTTNTGSAIWAGDIISGGSSQWRPGSDGGTLIFTGNALQGSRNFIVPRGTFQIASNAVVSATGTATAFGRDTTGGNRSVNVTIKDNAVVTLGLCSLGGNQAGGSVTLTIQNNAVLDCGANSFDVQNINRASPTTTTSIRLNGGTLTVGGFTKSKTGQTNVISFNGGVVQAGGNNTAFLPAFTFATNVIQAGGAKIDDDGFAINIVAPLLHDASLGSTVDGGVTKLGGGILTLTNVNGYTGPTLINAGKLLITASGGISSIGGSTNVYIGPGAVLDLSGTGSGNWTYDNRQTLWGNGSVKGNFQLGNNGLMMPGSNSIGTLTFSNSLALQGGSSNIFEISHSALTNDVIKVFGSLTNGGTLIITNLSGTLAVGDSFKLFNAASYTGTFASVILPALNPSLAWNTNGLNTNGVISVVSIAPPNPPVLGAIALSGNSFSFNSTGGVANATFYLMNATNLTTPSSNWTRLLTNQFDNGGNYNFTNTIDLNVEGNFFRLQLQ